MDLQPLEKAGDLLKNGILVATSKGVVCMTLKDALSSNLNLSAEDLNTVAEQLIVQEEISKEANQHVAYTFDPQQCSSDATVDSDEPTSDCSGIIMVKPAATQGGSRATIKIISNEIIVAPRPIAMVAVSDSDNSSSNMKVVNTAPPNSALETNKLPPKRRGGWPKGRKRKPELLNLPPKAPATGYNLYLNDIRKQFKDSTLPFYEITKIIGNRWSSLTLEQKQPFLERAEEDKRRYREELRVYRQSGAYQLYLATKRRKRVQNNVLSESDMDATDDIDDEDNEELYCRACDQWFHNLHNKREHLQGRQHIQGVLGYMRNELGSGYDTDCVANTSSVSFSTSLDESSLDATPALLTGDTSNNSHDEGTSVTESIANLVTVVAKREKDIKTLKMRAEEAKAAHDALYQQLCSLKERETTLKNELESLQSVERKMEMKVFQLWQVPSLFVTTDLNTGYLTNSEYLTDE